MSRLGFIHDKLDIKVLLLYLMSRVAAPIDFTTLTELTLCDDGIVYFDYVECLADLVGSEHLLLENDKYYSITEKGIRNGSITETTLPFTVRQKCDKALETLNAVLRRQAQVKVEILPRQDESYTLRLVLNDESDTMMALELFTASYEQAEMLGERFQETPERVYNGILELLTQKNDKNSGKDTEKKP